jgi:2-methylcitrate dehydratase PrpD
MAMLGVQRKEKKLCLYREEMDIRTARAEKSRVIFPKGHPNNRMSPVEVEAKFRACARGRMPSARQEKVIGKARDLEKLASLAELMNDLAEGETGLNRP